MEVLLVLGGLVAFALACFYLGYNTARERNRKWEKNIQQQYTQLLQEQRQTANSPTGVAERQGFKDGYKQGVEDAHMAIDKMTGLP